MNKSSIAIEALLNSDAKTAWDAYTNEEDIMQWNHASPDWHCPEAIRELHEGGRFNFRMAAIDGSFAFDFGGTYTQVIPTKRLAFKLDDGRNVQVDFEEKEGKTLVVTTFEPEDANPIKTQKDGWQAILDSFKNFVDSKNQQK